jgi:Flp pilus assembly pilin Flp
MKRVLRRFLQDECGAGLVEWAVVTVILILAIYAILQVIGPDVQRIVTAWLAKLR